MTVRLKIVLSLRKNLSDLLNASWFPPVDGILITSVYVILENLLI